MDRVTQLIGCYLLQALPFPAHLRENTDLCTGSTGTKCFQIKIIFPYALLACFILSLNLAGVQAVTAFPFSLQVDTVNRVFLFQGLVSVSFSVVSALNKSCLCFILVIRCFEPHCLFSFASFLTVCLSRVQHEQRVQCFFRL